MHRRAFIAAAVVGIFGFGAWFSLSSAQAAAQQAQAVKVCLLKVDGMTCGGCEAVVKSAAKKVDGVKDAKVNHEKGTAEVIYDPARVAPDAIAKAITAKSGFKARVQEKDKSQSQR